MYNDRDRRDSSRGDYRSAPRDSGYRSEGGYRSSGGSSSGSGYRSSGGSSGASGGGDYDDRRGRGVPLSDLDPALTDISRRVIGSAIEVHKALGPGFHESVYQKALQIELDGQGIKYAAGHPVPIRYRDQEVGRHVADLFVDERFFVDVMAEHKEIGGVERAQLRAQLRAADLELGLIINFSERRLKDGLVRVLNPDKLNALRGESGESSDDAAHDDDGSGAGGTYDPDAHSDRGG